MPYAGAAPLVLMHRPLPDTCRLRGRRSSSGRSTILWAPVGFVLWRGQVAGQELLTAQIHLRRQAVAAARAQPCPNPQSAENGL